MADPKILQRPERLASLDAYRGLVMFLMMGEVLQLCAVAKKFPDSGYWKFLCYHQSHVEWVGCSLHDLIQPSFSFMVGVALPFSLLKRRAQNESQWKLTAHAFFRALILVLLGVFLRSGGHSQTYWTFEDTLSQIGLGYGFLFLLALRSVRVQWIAFGAMLLLYWGAFALYPLPGVVGNGAHDLPGFAAHWNKNTNLAWAFDTWFLNLFSREKPFRFNAGGYATLSFIPTLATMLLGLLAGGVLLGNKTAWQKVRWLAVAGLVGLASGWLFGWLGVCPVVKKIWTPSWVLFSGGWCLLLLAAFYALLDIWKIRRWAFALTVVGMNSIAAYLIAHWFREFIATSLPRHFGKDIYLFFGADYQPFTQGILVLFVYWLILYWMYRSKIFLKV